MRREIVRIVTPGLMAEAELLRPKENNYLLALAAGEEGRWGIALLDLSTGEFRATEVADLDGARGEIVAIDPAEVLIADDESGLAAAQTLALLLEGRMLGRLPAWVFARDRASGLLCDFFHCERLEAFGCQDLPGAISAAGAVLHYLQETQKGALGHIRALATYQVAEYMLLDETTRRNLELVGTMRDNSRKGSLLGILDRTMTAMGGACCGAGCSSPCWIWGGFVPASRDCRAGGEESSARRFAGRSRWRLRSRTLERQDRHGDGQRQGSGGAASLHRPLAGAARPLCRSRQSSFGRALC